MTAIASWIENGVVYMGADTCASTNDTKQSIKTSKLFIKSNTNLSIMVGISGDFRAGQIFEWSVNLPYKPDTMDEEEYMHRLMQSYAVILNDHKFVKDEHSEYEFLVGINGRVFLCQAGYIIEAADNFNAVGSGTDYVLGAFNALKGYKIDPIKRVRLALETAAKYCKAVSGPFAFNKLPKDEIDE